MNKFLRTILFASFAMSASVVAAQGKYPVTGEPTFDREYKRLADDYLNNRCEASPDDVAPLLESYPQSPYVWRLSSELLLRARRYSEALEACDKGFSCLKSDGSELELSLVYCKFSSLVGLGRYADARAVLDKVIARFPNDEYLYYARGMVNECLGYFMQAEDDYDAAIANGSRRNQCYVNRANLMIRRGKYDAAAEFLKKNGGSPKLAEFESQVRLQMGQTPEAVSCFFFAAKNGQCDPLAAERVENAAPGYFKWALAANMRNSEGDMWLVDLKCSRLERKGRPSEAMDAFRACLADSQLSCYAAERCLSGELSCLLHLRRFSDLDVFCDVEASSDAFLLTSPLLVSAVKRNLGKEMPGLMDMLAAPSCDDNLEAMLRSGVDTAVAAAVTAADRDFDYGRCSASLYAVRAQANESLGRHHEAVADASECLRLYDRRNSTESRFYKISPPMGNSYLDLCDSVADARAALLSLAVLCEDGSRAEAVVRKALAYGINRDELLYAAACLRSRQGRASEAVGLLESALKAGFYDVEWLRRAPLLAEARNEPAFNKLMDSYAVDAAGAKNTVSTSAVSVACNSVETDGVARISGSVSGLDLEIVYDPMEKYNFISSSVADFLEKNGMLSVEQYGANKIAMVDSIDLGGGVVLRNVEAIVSDVSVPLIITSRALLNCGLPNVDRYYKKLTLTRVDF